MTIGITPDASRAARAFAVLTVRRMSTGRLTSSAASNGGALVVALREACLQRVIAALRPPVLLHFCHEGIEDQGGGPCGEHADPVHLSHLLRLAGERSDEHNGARCGKESSARNHSTT